MHIVLVHPEIPGNAGNVGRTCVALDATLHLVRPLGFALDEKKIRRSGLDYWSDLNLMVHDSLRTFEAQYLDRYHFFIFSRFGKKPYWEEELTHPSRESMLIFGSESKGLPSDFKAKYAKKILTIPMPGKVRSLNLSTSVGIAAYETLRQSRLKHL